MNARRHSSRLALGALAIVLVSACTEGGPATPVRTAPPQATSTPPSPPTSPSPTAIALTPETQAACRHAMVAVVAARPARTSEAPDYRTAEAAMYAAWRAGHKASDAAFVEKLLEPGSLVEGDTQTLAEWIDTLAIACGIPLFYE